MEKAHGEILKISSNQIGLAYRVFEPKIATDSTLNPLVFLHGITSCKETWRGIPQLLADKTQRRAYSYDVRNHGDSDWIDDFTVDDLVLDLKNFLESNGISKAVLIGHSLGGTTSINFALQDPEKVEMIIVEEMFVGDPRPDLCIIPLAYCSLAPAAIKLIPSNADAQAATKFIMDFISNSFSSLPASNETPAKIDKSTMALKRMEDGSFALKANMPVIEKNLRRVVEGEPVNKELNGTFNGPACFVYGELSNFHVLEDADNIKKYFPLAEFSEVKNARHTVHSDCPEEFTTTILSFILRNSIGNDKL